jgi:hypothetical protein
VDRITVQFEGAGAGIGGLTWGQEQVWAAMMETDSSLSMGGVAPITDGRTAEGYAEVLRFFMSRYAAMRTLLRFADDGTVSQQVFGSGETFLSVLDTTGGENPAAAAEQLELAWRERKFDYEQEWPLRMGVVRHDGVATHVVAVMCHFAADQGAVSVMMREVAEGDVTAHPPPAPRQPLDLVHDQQQPAAGRHTSAAMRYWESHLRAIPARRFTGPVDCDDPRYCRVVWSSPAMFLAAEAISVRLGADPAWVLLTAFAVGLGRVTDSSPLVAQVIIGNRFRSGLRDVVSPLTQTGLCVLDVTDVTAEEAIARARMASMSASKYAYYEPGTRLALTDRIEQERGERIDLGCLYNNRRTGWRPGEVGPVSHEDIRGALSATAVLQEIPIKFFNEKLMINVEDVPDTVQQTVEIDTRYVSLADLRALLHEMEAFTVQVALDPAATTGHSTSMGR